MELERFATKKPRIPIAGSSKNTTGAAWRMSHTPYTLRIIVDFIFGEIDCAFSMFLKIN